VTVSFRNPLRLGGRGNILLLGAVLVIIAIAIPTTLYWETSRNDMHLRWDLQARYAQEFWSQAQYSGSLINGTVSKWNNETAGVAVNVLGFADEELYDIGVLDTAHTNTLSRISTAIETLRTDDYIATLNQTSRTLLAHQLWSISQKIINANWNYANYTSTTPGVGPPFWYSGPAPPDETLLQNAVNIALAFERR